jgi:uridine phosphorylase
MIENILCISVLLISLFGNTQSKLDATDPVLTAKKLIEYKKANGHLDQFVPPKIVLICYHTSTLKYLLDHNPDAQASKAISDLYFVGDGQIGILGGWGIGAPALAVKVEELIALGVAKFVAVGTAGSLIDDCKIGDYIVSPTALCEDGVSHLYLTGNTSFSKADQTLFMLWNLFVLNQKLPPFHPVPSWSFSAIFREFPDDIKRVKALGCGIVEMEAATLYALGQEKGVQTLSLFVISDSVVPNRWTSHFKEPIVLDHLHQLADLALLFCKDDKILD